MPKKQFAFFWIGDDISIPKCLVQSIRHIYHEDAFIYQLSDMRTPHIEGVNKIIRKMLPKEIMLARLKAYCEIKNTEPVCFLDADSLIINKFDLPSIDSFKGGLVKRKDETSIINHNYPEYYPEFIGKTLHDVMPIYFGLIVTQDKGALFQQLLKNAKNLPERFHRWYGDQFSLAREWRESSDKYLLLDQDKYLHIVINSLSQEDLLKAKSNDVKIITFKGRDTKKFIFPTLKNLLSLN
jgi:hypothetical protein